MNMVDGKWEHCPKTCHAGTINEIYQIEFALHSFVCEAPRRLLEREASGKDIQLLTRRRLWYSLCSVLGGISSAKTVWISWSYVM
jgi:hypothetical protein